MLRNVNCITKPVQTSKGHSAVAGAAYRAGQNLRQYGAGENGQDKVHRYSPKAVVVRETFIITPDGSDDFMTDRQELWNAVEAQETFKNARLGRDIELGLAYELNHDEQRALIEEFVRREFTHRGLDDEGNPLPNFVADVAIHNYGRTLPAIGAKDADKEQIREWAKMGIPFLSKADAHGVSDVHVMEMTSRDGTVTGYKLYQPHAHVRVTPRPVIDGQFAPNKYAGREFNRAETAKEWRYEWPKLQNRYLEAAGSEVRVTAVSERESWYPDIDYLGQAKKAETHTIDARHEDLSEEALRKHEDAQATEALDDGFREAHNDTITDAFTELESANAEVPEEIERTRAGLWWHNMSQRFNSWRFEFRDHAREWRDRFDQQKNRIKQVVGWHKTPDMTQDETGGYDPPAHGSQEQDP